MAKSVSVIIVAHNSKEHIGNCLKSVIESSSFLEIDTFLEIIVVDDGSTDDTVIQAQLFKDNCNLNIIENRVCLGPGASRNIGYSNSSSEYLFFIDADCIADKQWISCGIQSLEPPDIVAVEGALYYAKPFPSFINRVPLNPFYNLSKKDFLTVPGRDYGAGNIAVKRWALQDVNGFNSSRYRIGREDTDLGFRLKEKGIFSFNENMRVTHKAETWKFRELIASANRYSADVYFFKDYKTFPFRCGCILHPMFLLMLLFPPLVFIKYRVRSLRDFFFAPQFYMYLFVLRLTIWKAAVREKVFLL